MSIISYLITVRLLRVLSGNKVTKPPGQLREPTDNEKRLGVPPNVVQKLEKKYYKIFILQ